MLTSALISMCPVVLPSFVLKKICRSKGKGFDSVYKRVESGRGSLGCHIVSDGKVEPYRLKLSVPSFRNLIALPYLLKGEKLGNMPAVYWSLNYWPVEADR